jgi:polysaccharide biosynthesis protein PslH
MAHILIAYKQFPAPAVGHAGGESLFRLMEGLYGLGHRITLVSRIADEERVHLPQVASICSSIHTVPHHRSLPGPRPLAFLRSYILLRGAIRRCLESERPDFLHVETTQTALAAVGLHRPPSSYRTQDVNWYLAEQRAARLSGFRRVLALLERGVFRSLEPWLARRYDLMLAISEGDRRLLAEAGAGHRLLIVPLTPASFSSVDVALSPEAAPPGAVAAPPEAVETPPNLLFVGALSRDHNQTGIRWFLDEIWPAVRRECGAVQLCIVGGDPPDWLLARADGVQVLVTGYVDDLAAWYRRATVFISPLLVAGGLLQKVIDAMASSVPVVATSVCNHGVSATPGMHLVTADDAPVFAQAVVELLGDPAARARLGAAGRDFVLSHYNLETAVAAWGNEIHSLITSAVPGPPLLESDGAKAGER